MAAAIWTVLTIGALAGMFAACVLAVVVGLQVLENALARRRGKSAGHA